MNTTHARPILVLIGLCFLGLGIFINEWTLGAALTNERDLGLDTIGRVIALLGNLLAVSLGALFLWNGLRYRNDSWLTRVVVARVNPNVIAMIGGLLFSLALLLVLFEVFFRFIQPYDPEYVVFQTSQGLQIYREEGLTGGIHFTFDPVTGYSLIPGIADVDRGIATDEYGFRTVGREILPDMDSIIFVGDSTVFGYGVRDQASFPYLVAQNGSLENYNVINMGVPAYSVGHIVRVLENKVPAFRPKIMFVAILWPWKPFYSYGSRDAWKKVDFDFYRATIPERHEFSPRRLDSWRMSRAFLVVRDWYSRWKYKDQIDDNLTRPSNPDHFDIGEAEERTLEMDHVIALKAAAKSLEDAGVKVVFYIHPYQHVVFGDQYADSGKIGRDLMTEELGATYMGNFLLDQYAGESFFVDGSHLNELGNAKYAQFFSSLLQTELPQIIAEGQDPGAKQ